jgi:uncharacterized protein YdeI (YjbR/CyaY-like superfamily)
MAAIAVNPDHIRDFATPEDFEAWLAAHHDSETELWLKIHKKGSGLATVTYAEALDVALCWGWIDGQKKGFDDKSFLQRFTPRGARSIWSVVNREHVARLLAAGRMQPAGRKQVDAAKADGRWERAYQSAGKMEMPADLKAAIAAEPAALKTFETLNAANRYALAFRTHNMKTAAGRQKKIDSFIAMLARGDMPYPQDKKTR